MLTLFSSFRLAPIEEISLLYISWLVCAPVFSTGCMMMLIMIFILSGDENDYYEGWQQLRAVQVKSSEVSC